MPLDENHLRRPDFVEGEPVVLADGQTWQLRRPIVRFVPAETEAGFAVCLSLNNDATYGSHYRRYEAVEPGQPVIAESLALARAVLLANYDLPDSACGWLIGRFLGNPATSIEDHERIADQIARQPLVVGVRIARHLLAAAESDAATN